MSDSSIAIILQNVSKKFRIYHDRTITLKESILKPRKNKYEILNVLDSFNLKVKRGEILGIIGPNGSGKSTILKLVSKIIFPTTGTIEINGTVSSLLELGAGFHPDFSGKENVYINASIFGMSKKEIDKKIDQIVKFSELEKFMDTPVRIYSTGMYMRLAFSVAINVDADILIIDEILAVGDVNFQDKCFNKLQELKKLNKTIIIVSHDLDSISKLCTRTILMFNGKIQAIGEPNETIRVYKKYMDN